MSTTPILYPIDSDNTSPFTCPWERDCIKRGKFVVVYTPWERPTRIVSSHKTKSAAIKAANKSTKEFNTRYSNGFGHEWNAAEISG